MASGAVQQFAAIAGCDAEVAAAYLQAADGSVDRALALYFDSSADGPRAAAQSAHSSAKPGVLAARRVPADDDYAAAAYDADDAGVRAPIRARVEQLGGVDAGPTARYATHAPPPQPTLHRAFRDFRAERADMRSAAAAANASKPAATRNLAALLRPPTELIFPGSFDEAREAARSLKRLLLVNIQVDEEFDCWALNRDTWKHEGVADVIKSNFIFWQQQWQFEIEATVRAPGRAAADAVRVKHVNPHASEFMTRYNLPPEFPVIVVVGFWGPHEFIDAMSDLLATYAADPDAPIPCKRTRDPKYNPSSHTYAPAAAPSAASVSAAGGIGVRGMAGAADEDGALAAAIAASLDDAHARAAAASDTQAAASASRAAAARKSVLAGVTVDVGTDVAADETSRAAAARAAEDDFMYDFDDDVNYAGMVDNGAAADGDGDGPTEAAAAAQSLAAPGAAAAAASRAQQARSGAAAPLTTSSATSHSSTTSKRSRHRVSLSDADAADTTGADAARKRVRDEQLASRPRIITAAPLPDPAPTATEMARLQVRLPDGARLSCAVGADHALAELYYIVSAALHAPHVLTTRFVTALERAGARAVGTPLHLNDMTAEQLHAAAAAVNADDVTTAPEADPGVSVAAQGGSEPTGAAPARSFDIRRPFPAVSLAPDAVAGKTFRQAGIVSAMLLVSWQ